MSHLVIQTENLPDICSIWLGEHSELHVCPAESLRFQELLPKAEGLVIRTYTTVDRAMIEAAPNLKVIGRAGVGIDNIDMEACKDHGVRVVHTPDANTESVVEFVLSRMLMMLRKVALINHQTSQSEWDLLRESAITPLQFNEMIIGIIGFGRIGSHLGKLATQLGFTVLFHDVRQIELTHGCTQCDRDEVLAKSNVISMHVDGRKENRNICDASFFSTLSDGCLFINTARGFIVDSAALAKHLRHDEDAIALLDVHNPEPIQSESPLLNLPNVELYPHIACKTRTAMINMGWVVKDVIAVLQNEPPRFEAL